MFLMHCFMNRTIDQWHLKRFAMDRLQARFFSCVDQLLCQLIPRVIRRTE